MGGSRAEKSCSREIQASVGLLDVPRAARTQPIQAEPTICPQTRPSSGNPYFSDPHAHLPLIKARRQGSTETSLSHAALHSQTWLDTAATGELFKIWMSGPVPRDSQLVVWGAAFNPPGDCHAQPSLGTTAPQQSHSSGQ